MSIIRFIGDVHGKYSQYKKILRASLCPTIQVGDLGVGFFNPNNGRPLQNPPHALMVEHQARFIRGNHDNPSACKAHSQYIQDGLVEGNIMFIGGALSIDKAFRFVNFDYWDDEELSYEELYNLIEKYIQVKPEIMVTHDCPEDVAVLMEATSGRKKLNIGSRTRDAFQSMLSAHSPKLWIYGHWHFHSDLYALGTRFVCLAELQSALVNTETCELIVDKDLPKDA